MADGIAVTPGSGAELNTDLVAGVHTQRVKQTFGADGVVTDVSSSDPLPVTLVGTATENIGTMPAAARTTDSISAALATDKIVSNLTELTPKFKKIVLGATGEVVAAVTSKKIRVLSYQLSYSGTVNAKWQSHVTPTDLSGLLYGVAGSIVNSGFSPLGHFETIAGEALDLNLSGSVAVGGHLTYIEVV